MSSIDDYGELTLSDIMELKDGEKNCHVLQNGKLISGYIYTIFITGNMIKVWFSEQTLVYYDIRRIGLSEKHARIRSKLLEIECVDDGILRCKQEKEKCQKELEELLEDDD